MLFVENCKDTPIELFWSARVSYGNVKNCFIRNKAFSLFSDVFFCTCINARSVICHINAIVTMCFSVSQCSFTSAKKTPKTLQNTKKKNKHQKTPKKQKQNKTKKPRQKPKKIINTKCNRKMERIFIRTDMDKRIHRNMKHTLWHT